MNYSELLDTYVKNSGLSLNEIVKKMEQEKGVKIDRSYISMLKNKGTKYPASEEINRALAEVIGGDPDKLVLVGYIERAPESVKRIIEGKFDITRFANHEETHWKQRALKAEKEASHLKEAISSFCKSIEIKG